MEIIVKDLPNFGVIETKLDRHIIDNLWDLIDKAKKESKSYNTQLAGNITSSLEIDDDNNLLIPILMPMINEYIKRFGDPYHNLRTGNFDKKFSMDSIWVNFQYENEFNPIHNHSGVFSFVIWMKIPTDHFQQKTKDIAKNSSSNLKISNFSFVYPDTIGQIREFVYKMDKEKEGTLVLFPSRILHQVYPFYDNKEERISISGNLGLVEKLQNQ